MKQTKFAILFAFLLMNQPIFGQTVIDGPKAVKWFVGKWESTSEGMTITENWEVLNDSTLIGSSSTLKDGNVVFSEKLAIEFRNSTYRYVADLGFKVATFLVQSIGDESISFVNPENDFPSRIIYVRAKQDLTITLEGKGQVETIEMKLK